MHSFLLAALLWVATAGYTLADDWKTTDGKVYEDVKLVRLDADSVTILDKDGGARIPLAKLPPALQKRFGYDPDLAKAAADLRAKEAALNGKELQAEMDRASSMHQAGPEPRVVAAPTSDDPTGPLVPATAGGADSVPISSNGTHHVMDEITSSVGMPTATEASHHSIDEATQTASAMRRDLSDPTYHTMAHMFYSVHAAGLGPDPTDTTHHSMDETTQAASQQK